MINHQDSNLFNSWNNRLKITPKDLEFRNKQSKDLPVIHREDLKNKYLGSLVSCTNLPGYINLLEDEKLPQEAEKLQCLNVTKATLIY